MATELKTTWLDACLEDFEYELDIAQSFAAGWSAHDRHDDSQYSYPPAFYKWSSKHDEALTTALTFLRPTEANTLRDLNAEIVYRRANVISALVPYGPGQTATPEEEQTMTDAARELVSAIGKLLAKLRKIRRGVTTRRRTKHIPYDVALTILERLNVPKDRKTLHRWMKGEHTPEDFTPETMRTVQGFTEWATVFAYRDQSKINTRNGLHLDNPRQPRRNLR